MWDIVIFIFSSVITLFNIIDSHKTYNNSPNIQEETSLICFIVGFRVTEEGFDIYPTNFIISICWVIVAILTLI